MTMIQAVITPNSAWIVSDSICASGPDILHGYEDHKLIALPKFVLTGLGSLALRHHAQGVAHTLPDVDAAVDRLPRILRDGYRVLGLGEHDATRTGFVGHTILCIGWSESRGHMVCVAFASGNDFEPELHGSAQQGSTVFWRNPDVPREPFSRYPGDGESLVNHAFATVAHWRSIDPCTPIGGRLHMAEIARDSIVVSVAGDLGMPASNERTEQHMPSKTLASFVVAAALAGCGGADDVEVTAAQLAPNSATKVVSASLDTADVWTTTATNHILQSVTVTNDDTVSRTVLLTGSLTYTFPFGIAAGNAIYGWCRQSTDAFALGAADFTHTVQATDDRNWTVAFTRQYTLAAGATGIYYLVGRESSFTTSMTYFGENIRAELIKR